MAFFADNDSEWNLRVQLCTDLKSMLIEDASVVWPESESPFQTVARLRIGRQPAWTLERSKTIDDGMAFGPWHCLAAHRPLGAIMRARRSTYIVSAKQRFALNGCPFHQPTADALPD